MRTKQQWQAKAEEVIQPARMEVVPPQVRTEPDQEGDILRNAPQIGQLNGSNTFELLGRPDTGSPRRQDLGESSSFHPP